MATNGKSNEPPLKRNLIKKPLDVGVRAINSLLTVGQGQRLGIIAGSGVGKSVLLGMMSKYTEADVVVVALIGERAREVGTMVNELFKDENSSKITVVAVPADRSPLMRIRAANKPQRLLNILEVKVKMFYL